MKWARGGPLVLLLPLPLLFLPTGEPPGPATLSGLLLDPGRVVAKHDLVDAAGAVVRGVVVDGGRRPVPGAKVFVFAGSGYGGPDTTDDRGGFEVSLRDPTQGTLVASADGFWPVSLDLTLRQGDVFDGVEVQLGAGPVVSGIVRDVDGRPLAGAELRVDRDHCTWWDRRPEWSVYLNENPDPDYLTRTREDGTFVFRGVRAKALALAVARDWRAKCADLRLRPGPLSAGPVRPLVHLRRLATGESIPAGGAIVAVPRKGNVEGVEIRLADGLPADQLCTVTGRLEDPSGRFAAEPELTLLLSEDPLGPRDLVVDKRPGSPGVRGTPVRIGERFRLESVIPSTYTLIAGANTEYLQLGELPLQPGEARDLGTVRIPVPGSLEGSVALPATDTEKPGHVAAGRDASDTWRAHIDDGRWGLVKGGIDPTGHYRLDGLAPGYWFVRAVYPETAGRGPVSGIKRVFIDGGVQTLNLEDRYSGRLAGRVVDLKDHPIPGAMVHIGGDLCVGGWHVKTDETGRYGADGLPPGPYHLEVARDEHNWRSFVPVVDVPADGVALVDDVVLRPAAVIRGRIVRPEGLSGRWDAEPEVELWTLTYRVGRVGPPLVTAQGEYTSWLLEPGTYVVKARAPGRPDGPWAESEPVRLAPGEVAGNVVVELPLSRGE